MTPAQPTERLLVEAGITRPVRVESGATPSEDKGEWVLPKFNGPDADGLYWLHFSAAKLHASINIRSGGIVERCIRAWLAAAPPASVSDPAAVERQKIVAWLRDKAVRFDATEWIKGDILRQAALLLERGDHHNPATEQKKAQHG